MEKNRNFVGAGVCCLLTVALIALLKLVDVAPIGAEGTMIGLSHLNQFVYNLCGASQFCYRISGLTGIVAILTALLFVAMGAFQMLKRRGILKVDKELLALGGLYVLVAAAYALFEIVIINYRPIIMPGDEHAEASFPSSHTMLVCVILGSAMMLVDQYVKNEALSKGLRIASVAIMVVSMLCRLLAGVHWFTDILGGVLIGAALLFLYAGALERIREKTK